MYRYAALCLMSFPFHVSPQVFMGIGVGMEQLPGLLALWYSVEEGPGEDGTGDAGSGDESDTDSNVRAGGMQAFQQPLGLNGSSLIAWPR